MFVAENLNSDEYPEVVGFKGRVQKHSCFDSRMHSGMRGSANSGFIQAMANKVSETAEGARTSASDMADLIFKNLDNVSKVSIRIYTTRTLIGWPIKNEGNASNHHPKILF